MTGSLFPEPEPVAAPAPLADRMRPRTLDELVGQDTAVGPGTALRRLIEQDRMPSLLLWGPPGAGKTSLARVLAGTTGAEFVQLSAVLSGVKDVRDVVAKARERRGGGRGTVLFVDEIHRFNKAQQDAFLPHVEDGTIVLVGATTENPGFHVNAPLLSRCRVVALERLGDDALGALVDVALSDAERGLGGRGISLEPDARDAATALADGDGRALLNLLENAAAVASDGATLNEADVRDAAGRRSPAHDRAGDRHYDLASALQKSIRSGDVQAGLYWCARLLEGGEDPLFVARRLVVIASEDVGLAQPSVLPLVMAARDAVHFLGMPEGGMALMEAVVALAAAPKSNSMKTAWLALRNEVRESGSLPVPVHLRQPANRTMRDLGYGKGYQYAHDHEDGLVAQEHLPDALRGRSWYEPGAAGHEPRVREHLERLDAFRRDTARAGGA